MKPLILASASQSRARVLTAAGLTFEALAADVDETALKIEFKAGGSDAADCARRLADAKARRIANQRPDALVIGADQMLDCDGVWFDKPPDLAGAADHLRRLSGKVHTLPTAAVVVAGAQTIWSHVAAPRLKVRALSDSFIQAYLAKAGPVVCSSVGAYQLEGLGAQLFETIEGDFFTILGLPLLPLLDFLREQRVLAT